MRRNGLFRVEDEGLVTEVGDEGLVTEVGDLRRSLVLRQEPFVGPSSDQLRWIRTTTIDPPWVSETEGLVVGVGKDLRRPPVSRHKGTLCRSTTWYELRRIVKSERQNLKSRDRDRGGPETTPCVEIQGDPL